MRLVKLVYFCFIFLVACAVVPPQPKEPLTPKPSNMLENPLYCNVDADCICGGIDKQTKDCFVGNKLYASKHVDLSRDCPDFCSGIAGHLETKCVDHVCENVPREGWNKPVACTEEAKVCPDGSAVGRVGPNCEFAPCPGEECSTNEDCVPAECCHSTSCVPFWQTPDCADVMCTMECRAGTIDCGGGCACENSKCTERLAGLEEPVPVEAGLSSAHWLCEDRSWKEAPEQCFENYCFQKSDCQLMGVTGICGQYMIAGPTETLHKPPVYYQDRCGEPPCSIVTAMCIDPASQPRIMGFDCVDTKCVVRTEEMQ